jgi:hypothetical protein
VLGADDDGESFTCGIVGRLKLGVLLSIGRTIGEAFGESIAEPVVSLVGAYFKGLMTYA